MAITINNDSLNALNEKRLMQNRQVTENREYVKGRNPITINAPPVKKKPDNRIPIPLAKAAVDKMCGYAGKTGLIQLSWVREEGERDNDTDLDEYVATQKEVAEYNESDIEVSELYEEALSQGVAYELFWVTTRQNNPDIPLGTTPEFKIVPSGEIVPIFSNTLKPVLECAIRFWSVNENMYAQVYYPRFSERWQRIKDETLWVRNEEEDTTYPYTDVPLAIYPINRAKTSLFQAEKGLIDANDKLLNKSLNEVDRFNALITLMPGVSDKEFRDKLMATGLIDGLERFDKWPEYLQKDMNGVNEFYKNVSDRLEELFWKIIQIPDFSDENFVQAQSGIAMAFKLLGLEYQAAKIETYFNKGLQTRNRLINQAIDQDNNEYRLVITSERNLPVDEAAKVEIATRLIGLVSRETLLRILPKRIVDDVERELERIRAELPAGPFTDEDIEETE